MTSNQRGPLISWATLMLQWLVQWAAKSQDGANPIKTNPSSDWSLKLDSMKLELLVIVDQHATVNTFPGLVHTARHTTKACCTRSRWPNPSGKEAPKVWPVIGVKS